MLKDNEMLLKLKKELKKEEVVINGKVKYAKNKSFGFLVTEDKESYFIPPQELKKALPDDTVSATIIENGDKKYVELKELQEMGSEYITGIVKERNGNFFLQHPRYSISMFVLPYKNLKNNDHIFAKVKRHPLINKKLAVIVENIICNDSDQEKYWKLAMYSNGIFEKDFKGEIDFELFDKKLINSKREEVDGLIAIDSKSTKDRDDVFAIKKTNEGFCLTVGISDVAEYIEEGSDLDNYSEENKNSFYLFGKTIHMLPRNIVLKYLSLNEGEKRLIISCEMFFDNKGKLINYEFKEKIGLIKHNYAYSELDEEFKENGSFENESLNILKEFKDLRELYRKENENIMENRVEYDYKIENNKLSSISLKEESLTSKMVQETMHIANVCFADFMKKNKSVAIFNNFNGYQKEKKPEIISILNELNINFEEESLFTFETYKRIQNEIKEHKYAKNILNALLGRSKFEPEGKVHFGLYVEQYATFTSPIRKQSDLINIRRLKNILRGESVKDLPEYIYESLKEGQQSQRKAEADIRRNLTIDYLIENQKESYEVEIVNVFEKGINVKIKENGVIGYVKLPEGEYNQVLKTLISENNKYEITDTLKIKPEVISKENILFSII